MNWFFQDPNFQLGDFIMLTSGLKAISELRNERINVYFSNASVRDLYLDCPFINILKKRPSKSPFASSKFSSYNHGLYRKKKMKGESMQECFFRIYAKQKGYDKEMPHTYVDCPDGLKLNKESKKRYVAIFHGCLGDLFVPKKSVPDQTLPFMVEEVLRNDFIPVILGSSLDNKRFWRRVNLKNKNIINYVGKLSIRDSVSVLSQCDNFISNDTGLYHVASALKKNGLVIWRLTSLEKNSPSYNGVKIFNGKRLGHIECNNAISDYLRDL